MGVATLRYLDTLFERGDMERSQYFKNSLSRVVTKLPKVGHFKKDIHVLSTSGRVLCLESRVSWVRVPPEAAHFSLDK